uniref:Uncharacterized protein n=1 Tax=viral metagenome TaxID=1070528 RepID=A0A6C0C515_9ZZZZ
MNHLGSTFIPCNDILEMIGEKVVKKRLENYIPIITNVIVENPQTWMMCKDRRTCKIVYKNINNIFKRRPTKNLSYNYYLMIDNICDISDDDTSSSGDEIDEDEDKIDEDNSIGYSYYEINDISEETSYVKGNYYYKTHRGVIENSHVISLLNSNIIKPDEDTLLNEDNIRKIINHKTHVKVDSLEKTRQFVNMSEHFKFTKDNIYEKLINMSYNQIIIEDDLFDILFNKNYILYSDTSDKFIFARYDCYTLESYCYNNPHDNYSTKVDIDYDSGEYIFEIKHTYYEKSGFNSVYFRFKTISNNNKLYEYSYYHKY